MDFSSSGHSSVFSTSAQANIRICGMLGRTILKRRLFRTIKTSTAFALFTSATALNQLPMFTSATANLEILQFPCLGDNYGYLLHDAKTGCTAAVDTPDAATYRTMLEKKGWTLTHILNTHHHWDHTGGNVELKASGDGVQVFGSKVDEERIPAIDISLDPEEIITFGSTKCKVIDVGGHTKGHIAFYFPDEKSAFVGDALFTLGCGRMFEGTPSQFWDSIQRLRELPDDTKVYCAHEYTESNAKFALSVEPGNTELIERSKDIFEKRKQGLPTVPSSIGEEKKTNPFLRGDVSAEIRQNVGASEGDTMDQIFAKIRKAKDNF